MIFKLFTLIGILIWLSAITYKINNLTSKPTNIEFELKLNNSEFMKNQEANIRTMFAACEYYGIKYPRIVTAQAVLESNNFKSKLFKEYNNPFGLYNSKTKSYFKFKHWTDAIVAYKNMIQYRLKDGEDYYKFLLRIKYAEDPDYINKVRYIESTLEI